MRKTSGIKNKLICKIFYKLGALGFFLYRFRPMETMEDDKAKLTI